MLDYLGLFLIVTAIYFLLNYNSDVPRIQKNNDETYISYTNGDTYKGEFKNNMRNGYGELKTNGHIFCGEFVNDVPYNGSHIRPDGIIEESDDVSGMYYKVKKINQSHRYSF